MDLSYAKIIKISGIALESRKNEAKRLNISDITVSNDDRLREWFKENNMSSYNK